MRKKLKKRNSVSWVTYTVVLLIGLAMLYPIIWMFFATFKSNAEIFGSVKLLPSSFSFQSYNDGWLVNSKITYTTFFKNSFVMTIITTLFTILSSAIVAPLGVSEKERRRRPFVNSICFLSDERLTSVLYGLPSISQSLFSAKSGCCSKIQQKARIVCFKYIKLN